MVSQLERKLGAHYQAVGVTWSTDYSVNSIKTVNSIKVSLLTLREPRLEKREFPFYLNR